MLLSTLKYAIVVTTTIVVLLLVTMHPGFAIKFSNYLLLLLLAYSLLRLFKYDKE